MNLTELNILYNKGHWKYRNENTTTNTIKKTIRGDIRKLYCKTCSKKKYVLVGKEEKCECGKVKKKAIDRLGGEVYTTSTSKKSGK